MTTRRRVRWANNVPGGELELVRPIPRVEGTRPVVKVAYRNRLAAARARRAARREKAAATAILADAFEDLKRAAARLRAIHAAMDKVAAATRNLNTLQALRRVT